MSELESVLLGFTNLEYVVQRKVSQKGKNKCCALLHIYGI